MSFKHNIIQIYNYINSHSIYIVALILLVSCIRIISTFNVFSSTFDEPYHINLSLLLWEKGSFSILDEQPALGRFTIGLLPYLIGAEYLDKDPSTEIFYPNNVLFLARISNIIFYLICALSLFYLTKRIFCDNIAVLSVLLLSLEPNLLAHSGLATVDIIITSTFTLLIFSLVLYLDNKNISTSLFLGFCLGLCFLSKNSAPPFFTLFIIILFFLLYLYDKKMFFSNNNLVLTIFALIFTISAAYFFRHGQILTIKDIILLKNSSFSINHPSIAGYFDCLTLNIFPFNYYLSSLFRTFWHNTAGHGSYFLGINRHSGCILYFPLAVLLKTTVPVLVASAFGIFIILKTFVKTRNWRILIPIIAVTSILAISATSSINIGIRHVLPLYPFLTMTAAFFLHELWISKYLIYRATSLILLIITILSSFICHPDYISYFNIFAGNNPENFLLDSNLDWGQDFNRLINEARQLKIQSLWIAYFGPKVHVDDISIKQLPSNTKVTGWIAISVHYTKTRPEYFWLNEYRPAKKIGSSILLYNIN